MADAPDLSKLTGDMYRTWEKSMSEWWDTVLESPAFLSAMGDGLTRSSQARKAYEENVERTLDQMHLPTKRDVVRLARIASLLEDRLLSMEDRLMDLDDRVARIEKETLQARIDAAEALVSVKESIEALRADLAADAPAKAARGSRAKKADGGDA